MGKPGRTRQAATAAIALLLFLAALQMPGLLGASAAQHCQPGQVPEFGANLGVLQDQLGDSMGSPLECVQADPSTGDLQVITSTGLAFYRQQTNTPTFTDGFNHYAVTSSGLVWWTGSSIDPPGVCLEPYDRPDRACFLGAFADTQGYLRSSGNRNVYTFTVSDPATIVEAILQDLPADYDLYLADSSNKVLAGSVLDGLDPRVLYVTLSDPGTYYLYVVSDPNRTADAGNPYHLVFAQSAPAPTADADVQMAASAPPPPPSLAELALPPDKVMFVPAPLTGPVDALAQPSSSSAQLAGQPVNQRSSDALAQLATNSRGPAAPTPTPLSAAAALMRAPDMATVPAIPTSVVFGGQLPPQATYPTYPVYPTPTSIMYLPTPVNTPTARPTATSVVGDTLPPTTTASFSPSPNAAGWYGASVASVVVQLTSVDAAPAGVTPRGVEGVVYSATGAQTITSTNVNGATATLPGITAEGITAVSFIAVDNDGNVESPKKATIQIDRTPPKTTVAVSPSPNAAGWNTTDVAVTLTASDPGGANASGVKSITFSATGAQSITQTTVAGSTANVPIINVEGKTTLTWFATDAAGNQEANGKYVIQLDKTPPWIAVTSPASGAQVSSFPGSITGTATEGAYGSGVESVSVSLQRVRDSLYWSGSGWQSAKANLKTSLNGASSNVNWQTTDALPSGSSATPGSYRACVDASDVATNAVKTPVCVDFTLTGLTATISLGSSRSGLDPVGLAVNASTNTVYVANFASLNLSVINAASNTVTGAIDVGGDPFAVAINASTNTVYVANLSGSVTVINGATSAVTTTIPVGSAGTTSPSAIAVNASTNTVYVVNSSSNTLAVINGATNAVAATIPVGATPDSVAVNPTTNMVYVSNSGGGTVSVINGASNTVTATVPIGPTGTDPRGVAVNASTNTVYVAVGTRNSISVINGATNAVTATIPVPNGPRSIALNPTTSMVYVSSPDGNALSVINGTTNAVVATVAVGSAAAASQAVAVNGTTNTVFMTNGSGPTFFADGDTNTVWVINGATNAVSTIIPVSPAPQSVTVNSGTNTAYVANAGASTVSVINGATNTVGSTISVRTGPRGAAVNASTNTLYVTTGDSNKVSVVNGATNTVTTDVAVGPAPRAVAVNATTNVIYVGNTGNNTVSVINGATNTVTANIPVGGIPQTVAVNASSNMVYVGTGGTVSVINGATNAVTATIPIAGTAKAIGVNPTTNTVYVANVSDTVSVVNGATNAVIATVTVGPTPQSVAVNPSANTIYVTVFGGNSVCTIDGATNKLVSSCTGVGGRPVGVDVNATTGMVYVANSLDNTVSVIAGKK